MYDPNLPEDDIKERYEEMERMREHVFKESDTNHDNLISFEEFMAQTQKREFKEDDGWKGLDEEPQYTPEEYQAYAKQHEEEVRRMYEQGLIPPAPPGYVPVVVPPGHHMPPGHHNQPVYHVPPGAHPNAVPHGQGAYHPQQGHPQQYNQHPNEIPHGQGAYHPAQGQPQFNQHPNAGAPPQPGMHQVDHNAYPPHHQQPMGYQQPPPGGYQQQHPPAGYQQQPPPAGYQQQGSYQQPNQYNQQGHPNHAQVPQYQAQHPAQPAGQINSVPSGGHDAHLGQQVAGSSHDSQPHGAVHQPSENSVVGGNAQQAPPVHPPQGANSHAQQQSH